MVNPDTTYDSFTSWAKSNGIKFSKLGIATFGHAGRGIVATSDISSGEVVLQVPRSLFMSRRTAANTSYLGNALKDSGSEMRLDDILALHILGEKMAGDSSAWAFHVEAQPQEYSNSWFFNADELAELSGSTALQYTMRVKSTAIADMLELKKDERLPESLRGYLNLQNYMWALSTVWSRGFDLEIPGEGRVRSLVPFADMANHTFGAACSHSYNAESDCLEFTAGCSYQKGEQVFISYGPFSSEKWLRVYGYVPPENPYDYMDLYIGGLDPSDPLYQSKVACLAHHKLNADAPFPLKPVGPFNEDVLFALGVRIAQDQATVAILLARGAPPVDLRRMVAMSLMVALRENVSQYPTSLEDDQELVKSANSLPFNRQNALFARLSEKVILKHSLGCLEDIIMECNKQLE